MIDPNYTTNEILYTNSYLITSSLSTSKTSSPSVSSSSSSSSVSVSSVSSEDSSEPSTTVYNLILNNQRHDTDTTAATTTTTTDTATNDNSNQARVGIVSYQDIHFFRTIQNEIDTRDPYERCLDYGFKYNPTNNMNRRVFYGALIADETYELLDIISTETYNVYTGIVFVESNRTQNLTPRPFRHLYDVPILQTMFNTSHIQIRTFVHEQQQHVDLEYEHAQRQEILLGWKELGMLPDDIGLLADTDETFTRDFLRALQTCDDNEYLIYNKQNNDPNDTNSSDSTSDNNDKPFRGHNCQHQSTKVIGATQVFESSPECIERDRTWHHPDMIIGHCIDYISTIHPVAPRDINYPLLRAKGYGSQCDDWDGENNITNPNLYPTWNAADFRRTCGGRMFARKAKAGKHSVYTGYHFHNFFLNFNQTRFKYSTYGHPDKDAIHKDIVDMSRDLKLMYHCIKNMEDDKDSPKKRIIGGYNASLPFHPIYFHDIDYRQRRHAHVQQMIELDTMVLESLRNGTAS
jgi:hypothetical protein